MTTSITTVVIIAVSIASFSFLVLLVLLVCYYRNAWSSEDIAKKAKKKTKGQNFLAPDGALIMESYLGGQKDETNQARLGRVKERIQRNMASLDMLENEMLLNNPEDCKRRRLMKKMKEKFLTKTYSQSDNRGFSEVLAAGTSSYNSEFEDAHNKMKPPVGNGQNASKAHFVQVKNVEFPTEPTSKNLVRDESSISSESTNRDGRHVKDQNISNRVYSTASDVTDSASTLTNKVPVVNKSNIAYSDSTDCLCSICRTSEYDFQDLKPIVADSDCNNADDYTDFSMSASASASLFDARKDHLYPIVGDSNDDSMSASKYTTRSESRFCIRCGVNFKAEMSELPPEFDYSSCTSNTSYNFSLFKPTTENIYKGDCPTCAPGFARKMPPKSMSAPSQSCTSTFTYTSSSLADTTSSSITDDDVTISMSFATIEDCNRLSPSSVDFDDQLATIVRSYQLQPTVSTASVLHNIKEVEEPESDTDSHTHRSSVHSFSQSSKASIDGDTCSSRQSSPDFDLIGHQTIPTQFDEASFQLYAGNFGGSGARLSETTLMQEMRAHRKLTNVVDVTEPDSSEQSEHSEYTQTNSRKTASESTSRSVVITEELSMLSSAKFGHSFEVMGGLSDDISYFRMNFNQDKRKKSEISSRTGTEDTTTLETEGDVASAKSREKGKSVSFFSRENNESTTFTNVTSLPASESQRRKPADGDGSADFSSSEDGSHFSTEPKSLEISAMASMISKVVSDVIGDEIHQRVADSVLGDETNSQSKDESVTDSSDSTMKSQTSCTPEQSTTLQIISRQSQSQSEPDNTYTVSTKTAASSTEFSSTHHDLSSLSKSESHKDKSSSGPSEDPSEESPRKRDVKRARRRGPPRITASDASLRDASSLSKDGSDSSTDMANLPSHPIDCVTNNRSFPLPIIYPPTPEEEIEEKDKKPPIHPDISRPQTAATVPFMYTTPSASEPIAAQDIIHKSPASEEATQAMDRRDGSSPSLKSTDVFIHNHPSADASDSDTTDDSSLNYDDSTCSQADRSIARSYYPDYTSEQHGMPDKSYTKSYESVVELEETSDVESMSDTIIDEVGECISRAEEAEQEEEDEEGESVTPRAPSTPNNSRERKSSARGRSEFSAEEQFFTALTSQLERHRQDESTTTGYENYKTAYADLSTWPPRPDSQPRVVRGPTIQTLDYTETEAVPPELAEEAEAEAHVSRQIQLMDICSGGSGSRSLQMHSTEGYVSTSFSCGENSQPHHATDEEKST